MSGHPPSIAIIGAGIGGLAAAVALHQAGIDVHVYEQSPVLAEVGAGVTLSANASRVLHRLGLAEALAAVAVKPIAWHQRRWEDGRTLSLTPLGDAMDAAFGHPHYQVHRADLVALLAAALPPERLHLGHRLLALADHVDHVEALFQFGRRIRVDALIGADGIHSAVRTALVGAHAPRFGRCVAYRGLIRAERIAALALPRTMQLWLGPDQHLVHYFVRRGELLNFVAVIDRHRWTGESWSQAGDPDVLRDAFAGWHPQVRGLLDAVETTFTWALHETPSMPCWSVGRISLLGDACHAMLPCMAQGAAQSIEDAATLAALFAGSRARGGGAGEVPAVLDRYQALRRPRTARVQALSAANKVRFHLHDGEDQRARDRELAAGAVGWSPAGSAWLYGHDPFDVDTRGADEASTPMIRPQGLAA